MPDINPRYVDEEELDEFYKLKKKQELERETGFSFRREDEPFVEEVIREVPVIKRRAIPKMEEEPSEPLKIETAEIIGSLFDRVRFLEERIRETQDSISTREDLHESMMMEIDKDITGKIEIESRIVDIDEKRSIMMDISLLRREKRRENVEFWKNLVELKRELKTLMEEYETESKILAIFKGMGGTE